MPYPQVPAKMSPEGATSKHAKRSPPNPTSDQEVPRSVERYIPIYVPTITRPFDPNAIELTASLENPTLTQSDPSFVDSRRPLPSVPANRCPAESSSRDM